MRKFEISNTDYIFLNISINKTSSGKKKYVYNKKSVKNLKLTLCVIFT